MNVRDDPAHRVTAGTEYGVRRDTSDTLYLPWGPELERATTTLDRVQTSDPTGSYSLVRRTVTAATPVDLP